MKIFVPLAVAGLLALRFSPWFWKHATMHERAYVVVAVIVTAGILAGTASALGGKGRPQQRRQRQGSGRSQRSSGYSYDSQWR